MGKAAPAPVEGDSFDTFTVDLAPQEIAAYFTSTNPRSLAPMHLGTATTRILYDLDSVPACASSILRETHESDLGQGDHSEVQLSFSYSDGFGREMQRKLPAEPGRVPKRDAAGRIVVGADGQPELVDGAGAPRWVGSGWRVFNNKGKPVRQFEPFFSDTHGLDADVRIGVSPWLFYDPADRVVATLHPNHTYEKVVFDPWRQATYDANDTVLQADGTTTPLNDVDVSGFLKRLVSAEFSPTWYEKRIALPAGDPERVAAEKSAVHRQTPSVAHLDALGRTFLTLTHNRYVRNGAAVEETYPSRADLDIEGNTRGVRDAVVQNGDDRGRLVMRQDYNVAGASIRQASMEAGEHWTVADVSGRPIRQWNSRGVLRRIAYDDLRRPTAIHVTADGVERLAERTAYGEGQGATANHRMQVYQSFDGAGVATNTAFDFTGKLREVRRDVLTEYRSAVNWLQNPAVTAGSFVTKTTYDALGRPRALTSPDGSVQRLVYNEANLLEMVDVNLGGAQMNGTPVWTSLVTDIDYDAKGQRERVAYGNGTSTAYSYDLLTFRLTQLRTTRPGKPDTTASKIFGDATLVQNLRYTHDPVGSPTRIEDAALKTVFSANVKVDATSSFTYDATYRLLEATGREHIGQTARVAQPAGTRRDHDFAGLADLLAHPNDLEALRNYTQLYEYDVVGNLTAMRHSASGGGWTRAYTYTETSLLEPAKQSNRLTRTTVGNGTAYTESYGYTDGQAHDVNGCMATLNSLAMVWDDKDQLQRVNRGGGGTAYYVYDGLGRRVRKVIEDQTGVRREERIYVGATEVFHRFGVDPVTRETLHLTDGEQRVAVVDTDVAPQRKAPVARFQLGNHLGSASLELDVSGAVLSYEEYHPHGTTSFQAGRTAAEVGLKRYRYTAKERDQETGFSYQGARYYAPWIGRWTSADPSGISQGLNPFMYCRGNPVRYADPDGRAAVEGVGAQPMILASGPYRSLDTAPGHKREHVLATNLLDKIFSQEYGARASLALKGPLRDRANTVLWPDTWADPKTVLDKRDAAAARATMSAGEELPARDLYLRGMRNAEAGGRLSAENKAVLHDSAVRQVVPYVKAHETAKDIAAGGTRPGNLSQILAPGTQVPTAQSEAAKVPVTYFPKTDGAKSGEGGATSQQQQGSDVKASTGAPGSLPSTATPPNMTGMGKLLAGIAAVLPALISAVSTAGAERSAETAYALQAGRIESLRTETTGVLIVTNYRHTLHGDPTTGINATTFVSLYPVSGFASRGAAVQARERGSSMSADMGLFSRVTPTYSWVPPLNDTRR
jgi:RHS repeat-associated protein